MPTLMNLVCSSGEDSLAASTFVRPDLNLLKDDTGLPKSSQELSNSKNVVKRWHQYYEVPIFCREPCILSGYRPSPSTINRCLTSVFGVHNETVNIWTHLLAALYFCYMFWDVAIYQAFIIDSNYWPYMSYMLTVCLYSFVSSMAHALSSVSYQLFNLCFCLDYTALSVYSFGSALVCRYYMFPDFLKGSSMEESFLPMAVFMAILATSLTCLSRIVTGEYTRKFMRLFAFAPAYLWANLPVILSVLVYQEGSPEKNYYPSRAYHINQILSTMTGVFFYSSNIPERFFPGKFDLIGQSHNILHVCGSMATYHQMQAILLEMETNKWDKMNIGTYWSTYGMLFVIIVNYAVTMVLVKFIPKEKGPNDDASVLPETKKE